MFFRLYKYSLIQSKNQKLMIFWNLIFPIILGTLFQVSFGNFIDKTVVFHQIPVAYVMEEGADTSFTELLKRLEEDSELIKVQTVEEKEAKKLLKEGKVEGIFVNREAKLSEISLIVTESDMNQNILRSILEQYKHTYTTFATIAIENPAGMQAAIDFLEEECQYLKESSITDTKQNITLDYFYSLIAMNCLMGATTGLISAVNFKANLSTLAARQLVAGTNRFRILLPDLSAKITIQFCYIIFSTCYLMFVMKVPLGEKWGLILLTIFIATILGIFLGFFIGVVGKMRESIKEAICVSVMMTSSFFSGLMIAGIRRIVEVYAPIFNFINPASVIVKALYSLNIYDTYERYLQCIGILFILIILLGIGSFTMIRRERYASI